MNSGARAAVFDLDGTLVDNMRYHGEAWVRLARRLGSPATREQFERDWAGRKSDEILPALLGRPASPEEVVALSDEKEADYRAAYGPRVEPVRGLFPFLEALRAAGYRLALATAAPPENRNLVLAGLGLPDAFAAVAGPELAVRGKPWPDIFLAAADLLGVPAPACVAFEDAANGVRAARAAGMEVVGIATGEPETALAAAGARFTGGDYEALPPACLAWLGIEP
ncbi:MAG TPA: HAD-IA family hydrolase [Anaeromyxobacteraceae bacterium]|nr:HAD-IA family hydrolase [Anaeromyxobacteraceae bacterium]